jgi:hypothetical protein
MADVRDQRKSVVLRFVFACYVSCSIRRAMVEKFRMAFMMQVY